MGVKHICVRIPALSNTTDRRALLMLAWSSLANWRHEMDLNCHLLCKVGGARENVFSCVSNKRAWLCSWDIQIQELPLSKYGTVVDMKLKEVQAEQSDNSWVSPSYVSFFMCCPGQHGTGVERLWYDLFINKTESSVLHCWEERKSAFVMGLYWIKRTWFALEDKLGRHLAKSSTAHFSHTLVFEVNFRENILLFSYFSSLFKSRAKIYVIGLQTHTHTL